MRDLERRKYGNIPESFQKIKITEPTVFSTNFTTIGEVRSNKKMEDKK
jgi:hypothetical protein